MARNHLRVVLIDTRNSLNIGAAARAVANFGFRDFRVVNPYEVSFREAVSAVGGADVLREARVFETVAEAIADCALVVGTTSGEKRDLQQPFFLLPEAGARIGQQLGDTESADLNAGVAVLFGSEKFGLSKDDLSYCHWLIRIPTVPETPSMNLGQAVAVTLYEIVRAEGANEAVPGGLGGGNDSVDRKATPPRQVSSNDTEQIMRMMLEMLQESGYTNRIVATSTERKIRHFLRRMNLSQRDVPLLLGILRQVLWKCRQTPGEDAWKR